MSAAPSKTPPGGPCAVCGKSSFDHAVTPPDAQGIQRVIWCDKPCQVGTICGHDRETLRVAITRVSSAASSATKAAYAMIWLRHAERANVVGPEHRAFDDVHDPAKLAAIIAELMRERGASVWHGPDEKREPSPTDYVLYIIDAGIRVYSPLGPRQWQKQFDMPQARTFALALLDAPATAQDIECMIEEVTR